MRKIVVLEHISLDGVIQAPGGPEEDTSGGFVHGGWIAPCIGKEFVHWKPPTGDDKTLGLVDFAMFPHLDHEMLPENTMADAERWAANMTVAAYAIDDETAIKVVDGTVEVVSEGHWKLFTL